MLKKITVNNYALINSSTIDFPGSLTVITGETGAGKSILLGALGLVLGHRAEVGVLNDKSKKCIVEAVFEISNYNLNHFFDENELDYESDTTLRREITPEGKSRAFINDTPVNLTVLKQLAEKLIDIHSQHETLLLNEASFQFLIVDSFAGVVKELKTYTNDFKRLKLLESELKKAIENENKSKKDLDYLQFQLEELQQAQIKAGQIQKLEEEFEQLSNAENILEALGRATTTLDGGEDNLLSAFAKIKSNLAPLNKYGKKFEEMNERVHSFLIELKELSSDISALESQVLLDPSKLNETSLRIDLIYRLFKKHNVKTEDELLLLQEELLEKVNSIVGIEDSIKALKAEVNKLTPSILGQAKEISKKRALCIPEIEKKISKMLAELSMPNANFKVELKESDSLLHNGINQIKFLFTANKGSALNDISKVASGGELSRLMLCIKALVAKLTSLPTIIFDEIDTGVSGDVAFLIGNILESMGKDMQVIAITHLPQMAAKGDHHLFVFKEESSGKTVSAIRTLSEKDRVVEIAKMLSTGKPTDAALRNAEELLNN